MVNVGHGKIGDLHYTAIASMGTGAAFYQVELPFSTNIHLLNIPKRATVTQLNPSGGKSLMESVALEGNYPNEFTMYCERGQQQQARYVMDPQAMVFALDFCMSHNWEIIDNLLYFVQASPQAKDDPTGMYDDIARFVEEIEPRISRPLTDAERNSVAPYGHDRREELECPVCSEILQNHDTYYSCPDGHGLLVTGRTLVELRKGGSELKIDQLHDKPPSERGDIACPSCGQMMHRVPYNGDKNTIIDSCSNCPYRWIDGADVAGIQD